MIAATDAVRADPLARRRVGSSRVETGRTGSTTASAGGVLRISSAVLNFSSPTTVPFSCARNQPH